MAHAKSREVSLAIKTTEELLKSLDALRVAWTRDHSTLPKGPVLKARKVSSFWWQRNQPLSRSLEHASSRALVPLSC